MIDETSDFYDELKATLGILFPTGPIEESAKSPRRSSSRKAEPELRSGPVTDFNKIEPEPRSRLKPRVIEPQYRGYPENYDSATDSRVGKSAYVRDDKAVAVGQQHGIKTSEGYKKLGSGAYGTVYGRRQAIIPQRLKSGRQTYIDAKAKDKPEVFKIEQGKDEGRLAGFITGHPKLSKLSGLPKFHNVTEVPGHYTTAMSREDLHDPDYDKHDGLSAHLGKISNATYATRNRLNGGMEPSKARSYFMSRIGELTKDSHPDHVKMTRSAVKAIGHLYDHGVALLDLHDGNWGVRPKTGEVIPRDLGIYRVYPNKKGTDPEPAGSTPHPAFAKLRDIFAKKS